MSGTPAQGAGFECPDQNPVPYHDLPTSSTGYRPEFHNIDQAQGLTHALDNITSCVNRNFILEFSDHAATAAFDLQAVVLASLLRDRETSGQSITRWVDISYPSKQKRLLELLARRYDFAPRLLAMMASDPPDAYGNDVSGTITMDKGPVHEAESIQSTLNDLEAGLGESELSSQSSSAPIMAGNLYDLLEDVWHYTSIDQGSHFYHVGDMAIPYGRLGLRSSSPLPHCVRVWTWLVLCDDRTVITISEDLFPRRNGAPSKREEDVLLRTKQKLVNMFLSLSLADHPSSASTALLPVRKRRADPRQGPSETSKEAPGLLFFFLFDNWYNSYSLVTRRDSRYGNDLENMRREMLMSPSLNQIDRLDQIGTELGALKRHYKSYIRIIDRITETAAVSGSTTLGSSEITNRMIDESWEGERHVKSLLSVTPGPAARVRFERLKDMISLYALSETKDLLVKKDTLLQMNFQLIAIKESKDVERLTRVSLFLAKATALFLPISISTAYFGTNLQGMEWSLAAYWISFACILVTSYVAMIGFGIASGTMESWPIMPASLKRFLLKFSPRKLAGH